MHEESPSSVSRLQAAEPTNPVSDDAPESKEKRKIWKLLLPITLFMGISVAIYSSVDLRQFQNWLEGCNGALVFVLIAILPLFGFPASLLQILAGARFGIGMGFLVSTLAI